MLGVYVRLSVVYPRLFGDFNIDARLGSLAARDGPTLMVARVRAAASRLKVYGESYTTTTKQHHPNPPSPTLATSPPTYHHDL